MGNKLKSLYNGQPGITNTELYTTAVNTTTRVLAASATNDTTTAVYVTLHRVPSGDTAGDANIISNQKVIGGSESVPLWELVGQILEAGDSISAIAEVADQVTVQISGVEVT